MLRLGSKIIGKTTLEKIAGREKCFLIATFNTDLKD